MTEVRNYETTEQTIYHISVVSGFDRNGRRTWLR